MSTINDQTDPEDQPICRGELDVLLANNQEEIEAKMRSEMRREMEAMEERLGGPRDPPQDLEEGGPAEDVDMETQNLHEFAGAAIEVHVQEHTHRR